MTKSRDLANSVNAQSIPASRLEDGTITDNKIAANAEIDSSKLSYDPGRTGSVATETVEDKLRESISVLDFGADPSGAADSSPAFQAAINSYGSGNAFEVLVPKGTYKLNSNVEQNGRRPLFIVALGAVFTGPGQLNCIAEWWTNQFAKRYKGDVAWAFGGQRGSAGGGAILVGGGDPYEGLGGSYIAADGHGNWITLTSSREGNPTEFIVYPAALSGRCRVQAGTNRVIRLTGQPWTQARVNQWIGRIIWIGSFAVQIQSRVSDNEITVAQNGNPVSWGTTTDYTYHWVITDGDGVCTVSGTSITRVNGTPFIPFIFATGFRFLTSSDNGVTYVERSISSFVNTNEYTATTAFGNGTYRYRVEVDIFNQLSTLRIQKLAGIDEENVNIFAKPDGYWFVTGNAGVGDFYPIWISAGSDGPYNPKRNIRVDPSGFVCLGGDAGKESIRALYNTNNVNRLEVDGGLNSFGPSLRARGADTNVKMAFDTKGSGEFQFTTNSFGLVALEVKGPSGSNSFVEIMAGIGEASINAKGSPANVDIKLSPKGSGMVKFGAHVATADAPVTGYIYIKDSSGIMRKVAIIN